MTDEDFVIDEHEVHVIAIDVVPFPDAVVAVTKTWPLDPLIRSDLRRKQRRDFITTIAAEVDHDLLVFLS
jgi:hypothetical protein